MNWIDMLPFIILGIFGIKMVFYDFPIDMEKEGWHGYFKNVITILLILGSLAGIGYLFGGLG